MKGHFGKARISCELLEHLLGAGHTQRFVVDPRKPHWDDCVEVMVEDASLPECEFGEAPDVVLTKLVRAERLEVHPC